MPLTVEYMECATQGQEHCEERGHGQKQLER